MVQKQSGGCLLLRADKMAIAQSITIGDKLVYAGPEGDGRPDPGAVGVLDRIEFPPNATLDTPAVFVVSFQEGQVSLPATLFAPYKESGLTLSTAIRWGVGLALLGGLGYLAYRKYRDISDEGHAIHTHEIAANPFARGGGGWV